jgi:sulfur-carrier protein
MEPQAATEFDVLLFASYADAFGARSVRVRLSEPARVSDLLGALRQLPGGGVLPDRPLVAIDRRYARGDIALRQGSEIAVIPPVAGG